MPFEINTKGKGLFLGLASISLIIMLIVTTLLWWFISPRLHEIHKMLAFVVLSLIRGFYLIVAIGIILVLLTSYLEKNFLVAKFAVRLSILFLFPITVFLGKLVGISKDKIRTSFVFVNNSFVKASKKSYARKSILVLLPHCLQNRDCKVRITTDINNCTLCGKCDIADLKKIGSKYSVNVVIATGGTLARRVIIKLRPKFIIAVACQRDLVDGIQDTFPIPVFGVLNELPEGPCINTRVLTSKIHQILEHVIKD